MTRLTSALLIILTSGLCQGQTSNAVLPERHFGFLEKNCLECHDSLTQEGKIDLEVIPFEITTLKDAETWQKVLNSINSKEMPPEEKPQPSEQEKTDFLASLSETLATARKTLSDSGGVATLRRLNRREYENTIYDLLGVPVDPGVLPADFTEDAFDNAGSSLYISSDQIANYRDLGLRALNEAFEIAKTDRKSTVGRYNFENGRNKSINNQLAVQVSAQSQFKQWSRKVDIAASLPKNVAVRNEIRDSIAGKKPDEFYRQWQRIEGAPGPKEFGFVDAADALYANSQWQWLMPNLLSYTTLPHRSSGVYLTTYRQAYFNDHFHIHQHLPAAQYKLNLRVGKAGPRNLAPYRKELPPVAVPPPSPSRYFIDINNSRSNQTIGTFQVHGTIDKPNIISTTVTLRLGEKLFFTIRERGEMEERVRVLNQKSIQNRGVVEEPAIWIDYAEYVGPMYPKDALQQFDKLIAWLNLVKQDGSQINRVIQEFTTEAMRGRSPSKEFVDKLVALYQDTKKKGSTHEQALAETLSVVLASPGFLYLSEAPQGQQISDLSIANRLSYFLTGSQPDAALAQAARSGKLKDKEQLKAHANRLLRGPDSDQFVIPFLEQWLGLDRLDFFQFDTKKHPDFTLGVKKAARQEIYHTFKHWINQNGSLGHLLKSDTIVINGLLGDLYQIPDVVGDEFRPVKVPTNSPRGGLLGMAAVSAKGSNGEDTSPVERGAWVLRKLMNNPPPPAPPNIPQLSRLDGQKLSTKEIVIAHQKEAQCAQCHRKIDPIGFGLENFNAIGKWRTMDDRKDVPKDKRAIDPSGKVYGGPGFKDYFQLRSIIRYQYIDQFAHGFAEHLAEYALGRRIGFTDQPLIEDMVAQAKQNNYAIPVFIEALVTNEAFRTKK